MKSHKIHRVYHLRCAAYSVKILVISSNSVSCSNCVDRSNWLCHIPKVVLIGPSRQDSMWRTILRVYAFLFFQNSYGKRFVLALFYWLLRALLGKYLLNYRYSYRHYYIKAVDYLIKNTLRKNRVTMIKILANTFIQNLQ